MVTVVGLVVVCVIAQSKEFPRTLIACAAVAVVALSSFIGYAVAGLDPLSAYVGPVSNTVCNIYYGVLVLWPCIELWRISLPKKPESSGDIETNPRGEFDHAELKARCDVLSDQYGLTRREREVFAYLGRGYSPAFVARMLYVSESTVRSHVKAIYRKLGVSSREELITMVDSDKAEWN